ncbi:16S rRNA (guanine(966)-N(2))-methyltransferase RsmD [Larsenimonas salina]|uniref:16S rRNA (guanine(966)-N(2))-methyltransferase RsmD n=1 Tax=Larsenimonas salina TaxID=1295565 RepID=UPI002072FF3B|nr:16S rRNA (guanine(966)-N(2))-methyltransferase RsmD [Larsenimonas salina]MCM5705611.1 16S rRNA (guanine(966)-N(2))-methyltransferase RsmD [Larsenimonas salina]
MTRHRSRSPSKPARHGKLRLIGGDFKRRQLPILDRPGLRPTPDRVRETLFNWIGPLSGTHVLDAFAGSGALGLEALSRGAASLTLIEKDRQAARQLEDNLTTLDVRARATLHRLDALTWLDSAKPTPYGLVFLDPPFGQGLADPICALLERGGWLTEQAMIYLEVEQALIPNVPAHWRLEKQTRAGETQARLYRRTPLAEGDTDA